MEINLDPSDLESLQSWIGVDNPQTKPPGPEQVLEILEDYKVNTSVQAILAEQFEGKLRVALQFPDHLLRDAPIVCEALRVHTEQILSEKADCNLQVFYFLLGDTSYGECCIDEVAAQHLGTDVVVHYGNACLSPTQRLPALYIFPRYHFADVDLARRNFETTVTSVASFENVDRVVLLYDLDLYSSFENDGFRIESICIDYNVGILKKKVHPAKLVLRDETKIVRPKDESQVLGKTEICIGALSVDLGDVHLSRTGFLWLTHNESLEDVPAAARNAALQLCTGPGETCAGFYAASLTNESESEPCVVDGSRMLRKRFALLSKLKDAERIGIVPGTLGMSGNLEVIERCKRIVEMAGKRSYVILVGKPNPSKLGNFAEIDVFVLVACPQNCLLEGRDYLRAIVTPLELEAGLLEDGDLFSRAYSTDFRGVLGREIEEGGDGGLEDGAVVANRAEWKVRVGGEGGAAEFLQSRVWRGLGYNTGGGDERDVSELSTKVEMGRRGIASRYEGES